MTYPDGRQLTYDYGTSGSTDDKASRIAAVKQSATALAEYTYLGLSSIVEVDYTQPQIKYDLIGTGSYPGLDQFNRIVDSLWTDYGSSSTAAQIAVSWTKPLCGLGHTDEMHACWWCTTGFVMEFLSYDRVSNRTFRKNPVDPSSPRKFDALYSYDELYRLSHTDRGEINTGNTAISNLDFAQCWTLDETGNWSQFRQDNNGDGTWNLVQDRTANQQNEITDVVNTVGSAWGTPKYDQAGNLILFKPVSPPGTPTWGTLTVDDWNDLGNVHGQSYTYDAWNRQIKLEENNVVQQENAYDGLGRRIIKKAYSSGSLSETRHYYYSAGWQVLEERVGTSPNSADAQRQYVWGLRYIDDLILRDRDTTNNGTLDERLYALQDANWNVTALTNSSGDVQERYEYDAYGQPTFLTPAFGSRGSSSYDWETLYASYRWDADVELYHVRFRVYDPQYGIWMQRDPIGFAGGSPNLYDYSISNPVVRLDPFGLKCAKPEKAPLLPGFYEKKVVGYLGDYWDDVYKRYPDRQPRLDAGGMKRQLMRGCLGITCLGLGIPATKNSDPNRPEWYQIGGSQPSLAHCYETKKAAEKVAESWNNNGVCCEGSKNRQSIHGKTAAARIFMVMFNDTIERVDATTDMTVAHTTTFTRGDSGRYNLEKDPGLRNNPFIGEKGNIWEHFRTGNFDFALWIQDDEIRGGIGWIDATGNGPSAKVQIMQHERLLHQYEELSTNRPANATYRFNCHFYCIACETPWEGNTPGTPIVPS